MRLDLDTLRKANVERCANAFGYPVESVPAAEWMCRATEEVGEAARVINKFLNGTLGGDYRSQLADEIADAIITLDLLAAAEGIDLCDAVSSKFNEVSRRVGSNVRIFATQDAQA